MAKGKSKPGDGERRAIRAYGAQYRVAAALIYDALWNETLEWIRLADPEAGRVDDIQIATPKRLDAYQVKWNDYPSSFTYKDLIKKGANDMPSLFRQLADGWEQLSQQYSERVVHVHLATNDIPSTSSSSGIPLGEPNPTPKHFSAFLRNGWEKIAGYQDAFDAIEKGWLPAIQALVGESELEDSLFTKFAFYCSFDFNVRDPRDENDGSRSSDLRKKDIHSLSDYLFRTVGGRERKVELTKAQLLSELKWEDRFEFSFRHEFPVDEFIYKPIAGTIADLENALSKSNNGYIGLLGTPGSGKSTTLTQHFRYKKNTRIIKYYAFIPGGINAGRGEAFNFLHDLYVALRQHGFYGTTRSFPATRDDLVIRIQEQFQELHADWQNAGTKTLILIDGLDHIEREQSPERSFLRDLPPPDEVPEGVVIIFGSQKINLEGLAPAVKRHLESDGRLLEMRPLERSAIYEIARKYPFSIQVKDDQIFKIADLSAGHPLALAYLLQNLATKESLEEFSYILNSTSPFEGHVDKEYEKYWEEIKGNERLQELFGYFCRVRGDIDLKQAIIWSSEGQVSELIKSSRHFFRAKSRTRWSFFHNSFKQFLLKRTSENIFGDHDINQNIKLHRRLAEDSAKSPMTSPWAWEQIYHYSNAGDHAAVMALGTQEHFRQQFFNFRPFRPILEDITTFQKSARELGDGVAIVRGLLAEKELRDRDDSLSEADFPRLIVSLKGAEEARNYIYDGQELFISDEDALKLVSDMLSGGAFETAKELFDAAEPLSILSGSAEFERLISSDENILNLWAEVAHFFRPLETIISNIDQVRSKSEFEIEEVTPGAISVRTQESTLRALITGVLNRNDKEIRDELIKLLQDRGNEELLLEVDIHLCLHHRRTEDSAAALERILSKHTPSESPV